MQLTLPPRRALTAGLALAAGLGYAAFARAFGGLPCPFRLVTGLKCPGCGITTLLLRLMEGDFAGAFAANPFLLLTAPVPAALLARQAWLRRRKRRPGRAWDTLCLLYLAALLAWGAVRNLAGL